MQIEPIINARFRKFRESYELVNIPDGEAFERFVNYVILSIHHPAAFTADSELLDVVSVGGSADMGIDGLAIKINGLLIKSKEDIDDILERYKRANVEFLFIQSKYKPKFNKGELNNFIDGVRDFLSDVHHFPYNDKIKYMLKLKEYLLSDDIAIMWDRNPQALLYYVAMGRWRDAPDLVGLAEQFKRDLSALNIYEDALLNFVDSESLKNIYDSIENTFTETINTRQIMPLTDVDDVTNSCISLLYADELIKLLTTDEGAIRKSLFDNNVRDYQGDNVVNSEIMDTIRNQPSKFILLNNGITIVCDEFIQNNTRLTIKNPQIVNGCQTSHVLYNDYKKGIDLSKIPISAKIISTTNLEISNEIVRGNNRQNIVLEEAFETTKKFHKDLEQFFMALSPEHESIYYERRSKQFSADPRIKQTQKVNLKILTQYFVAMYLNKPEVAHRHESVLLKMFSNIIFQEHHSKLQYFTSSLAFLTLERLYRENHLSKKSKAFKAHLLMLFREVVAGSCPNINNEKLVDTHSTKILNQLKDKENTIKLFIEMEQVFEECSEIWVKGIHKSIHRMKDQKEFTELLLSKIHDKYKHLSKDTCVESDDIFTGTVIKTLFDRNGERYGFISRTPNNIFFHQNQNRDLSFINLVGKTVAYKLESNAAGDKIFAVDVHIFR